jgi:hypothetical protein
MDTAGTSGLYFTYAGGGLSILPSTITTNVTSLAIDAADHVFCLAIADRIDISLGASALQPKVAGGMDVSIMKLDFSAPPPNPVQITKVNVVASGVDIAQNTWIEIHGTGLAPASVPAAGTDWSAAPEFASGRMPTSLAGVSVKVNGKAAYVYYVSATQVNVLTPLDSTTGQVQVTLANGSNTSDPFAVNLKTVAPAFLQFGSALTSRGGTPTTACWGRHPCLYRATRSHRRDRARRSCCTAPGSACPDRF